MPKNAVYIMEAILCIYLFISFPSVRTAGRTLFTAGPQCRISSPGASEECRWVRRTPADSALLVAVWLRLSRSVCGCGCRRRVRLSAGVCLWLRLSASVAVCVCDCGSFCCFILPGMEMVRAARYIRNTLTLKVWITLWDKLLAMFLLLSRFSLNRLSLAASSSLSRFYPFLVASPSWPLLFCLNVSACLSACLPEVTAL